MSNAERLPEPQGGCIRLSLGMPRGGLVTQERGSSDVLTSRLWGLPSWEEMQKNAAAAKEAWKNSWDALERAQPWIAECRNLAIQGVARDSVARDSYFKLCAAFPQPELLEWLVGMAASVRKSSPGSNWFSGLPMTRKQMTYLPVRIEGLAKEIETLNRQPLVRPDVWIHGRRISKTQPQGVTIRMGRLLMGLPNLLRFYAAFLGGHSKSMSAFLRKRPAPRLTVLRALIGIVRKETGRPMFSGLSNVLIAAAGVAGWNEQDERSPLTLIPLNR